jgi:hypothetical protein
MITGNDPTHLNERKHCTECCALLFLFLTDWEFEKIKSNQQTVFTPACS